MDKVKIGIDFRYPAVPHVSRNFSSISSWKQYEQQHTVNSKGQSLLKVKLN